MKQKWKKHSWAFTIRWISLWTTNGKEKHLRAQWALCGGTVGLSAPAVITGITILTRWGPRTRQLKSGPCKNTPGETHPYSHLHLKGNWKKEHLGKNIRALTPGPELCCLEMKFTIIALVSFSMGAENNQYKI